MIIQMENCPCGSGKIYNDCCGLYITGKINAPTPEALMRSRYTAYVVHAIDYIIETCLEGDKISRDSVITWSEKSKWLGLKIISVIGGDEAGTVIFEAIYEQKGIKYTHHEIASFIKRDNRWYYSDGKIEPQTVVRSGPKVGRNDLCFCGSGKKYKRCCGA
jgi:SEC-C motif-containing protein